MERGEGKRRAPRPRSRKPAGVSVGGWEQRGGGLRPRQVREVRG